MEEVYVIKLKSVPSSPSTSETSTSIDGNELIRISSLGLGVLHIIFGTLVLVFGVLRTTVEQEEEPGAAVFGTLFGPIFLATGMAAVYSFRRPYRKIKMKILFGLSLFSTFGSTAFLCLCFLGLIYFHSVPRVLGDSAKITANAVLAAGGEFVVSLVTVFTAGSALWQVFRIGAFKPQVLHSPPKQKVIVKTNIVGNGSSPVDEDVVRHVSPNCVISLRATDEQREVVRRVQEYVRDLHSQQEDISFTFSEPSTMADEQDLGVDSENWRNEVLALANQTIYPQIEEATKEPERNTE